MEPSDIRRLLDAFEHSEWNEIRLSVDGVEVFISASDAAGSLPAPSPRPAAAEASTRPAAAVTPAASAPAEAATKPAEVPDGTPVRSPSPGIFWCAPAPGAPPFVAVGDHVEAESVVCIVEVMKLMNRVVAGVSGKVVAICVANSEQVARDQVLVVIEPDTLSP